MKRGTILRIIVVTRRLDGGHDFSCTLFLGLTPLHCAVVAHNAVVHELQRNQQPHSPEVQDLLLKNKCLVDTIKCLIQMGAAVEAKVTSQSRLEVGAGVEGCVWQRPGLQAQLETTSSHPLLFFS